MSDDGEKLFRVTLLINKDSSIDLQSVDYFHTPFLEAQMYPVVEKGVFEEVRRITTLSFTLLTDQNWLQ